MTEPTPLTPKPSRRRDPSVLVLDAPEAPDALPLEADDTGHKIPVPFQSTGLRVEVPRIWSGADLLDPGDVTVLDWLWDGVSFQTIRLTAPYDASDLPDADGLVPPSLMDVAGMHRLQYQVLLRESSGNDPVPSFTTVLDSDKVGPNQGQRGTQFQFDADIEREGVTDAYLDNPANNNRVVATISPVWLDIRLGDVVEAYLTLLPFSRPLRKRPRQLNIVATTTIVQAHKDGTLPIEIHFPGDFLRGLANREYNAHYYLRDRSGRESGPSRTAVLLINLTPTPVNLPIVDIPQLDDGLIDLSDAREPGGVFMSIPEVFGAAAGDFLRPFWDLIALPPIEIAGIQNWPIPVFIPYSILAAGGAEFVRGTVRAEYRWQRGTAPARPSPVRFVPVDLTVAGPVSPTNPDPINQLLELVTVRGRDGDNLLTINDVGLQVRVVTRLYNAPFIGELLELMVGTHPNPVATYRVQASDVGGQEIEWLVDWDVIEPLLIGGLVPFFYWTFNGVNRQRAQDTQVVVNIVAIGDLKDLEYVGVHYGPGPGSGFIGCPLRPWVSGVGVHIPGDDRWESGDEVVLHWESYANSSGNPAGVIPETVQRFGHTLTADEARSGYEFRVPFDPYILLPGLVKPPVAQYGCAVAHYQIIKAGGGGMGSSLRRRVFITLIQPGDAPPCLSDD